MMMRCTRIRKRLPLFVGGDLSPPEMKYVEAHVATCLSCYRVKREFEMARDPLLELQAQQDLCSLDLGSMAEDVIRAARAQEDHSIPEISWESRRVSVPLTRLMAAAAGLLLLVLGTGFLAGTTVNPEASIGYPATSTGYPATGGFRFDSRSVPPGSTPVFSPQGDERYDPDLPSRRGLGTPNRSGFPGSGFPGSGFPKSGQIDRSKDSREPGSDVEGSLESFTNGETFEWIIRTHRSSKDT